MEKLIELKTVLNELILIVETFQALDNALRDSHSAFPKNALIIPIGILESTVSKAYSLYEQATDELQVFKGNEVA